MIIKKNKCKNILPDKQESYNKNRKQFIYNKLINSGKMSYN